MTAMTSAGTTLGISAAAPATFNEAGFEALSFSTIGEITDIGGDIGRVYNLVTHNPLATRATVKKKGSYNSGSMNLTLALDIDDAGQVLMEAALTSDSAYSFKLTRQDGTVLYFQGMVMSFPENAGGVDSIAARTATIEITANDAGADFVEAAS
jgi:hypothetical protein